MSSSNQVVPDDQSFGAIRKNGSALKVNMWKWVKVLLKWMGHAESLEDALSPFYYMQLLGGLSPIIFTPHGTMHIASIVALPWTVAVQTMQIYVMMGTFSDDSEKKNERSPLIVPIFYGCRIIACCTMVAIPVLKLVYCRVITRFIQASNKAANSVESLGIAINYRPLKIRTYKLLFIWFLTNICLSLSSTWSFWRIFSFTIMNCTHFVAMHFYMITFSQSYFLKLSNNKLATFMSRSDEREISVIVVIEGAIRDRRRKRLGEELAQHSLVHLRTHAVCDHATMAFGTSLLSTIFIWMCFTPFAIYFLLIYIKTTLEWNLVNVLHIIIFIMGVTLSTFFISLSVCGIIKYASQVHRMQVLVNDMRNERNDDADMLEQELAKIVLTYFIILMQYHKTIEIKAFIRDNTH